MKKAFVIFCLIMLSGSVCFAYKKGTDAQQRRGCCSHHGGVCGCSHNRAVCCDGSYSPTCGCD